ncbi:MAG: beta-ketoacyl synthase N-terminal-like domain-containing protein [Thermoanaerobaculia bacterium]
MSRRIGITGVGLVSALADEPLAFHRALRAGARALQPVVEESLPDLAGRPHAPLPDFAPERYLGADANLRPLDGAGRRLASAAALALDASGWSPSMRAAEPVGLVVGTMFAGMRTIAEFDRRALEAGPQYVMPLDFANTVFNAAAGQAAIRYRLTGPNATLGGGPVAAVQALGYAAQLIRSGQVRAVLAGGVDELSREALVCMARAGLLSAAAGAENSSGRPGAPVPFDTRRDGCALGEGAVLFMIEAIDDALERGAPILAEIVSSASAWAPPGEAGSGEDPVADALARVISTALADAGLAPEQLDAWSSSASGAISGDVTEARGFVAALGAAASTIAVTAVKGALGEALGAAGALQTLVLLGAMRDGFLPGVAGLEAGEPGLGIRLQAAEQAVDLKNGLVTAVGFEGAVEALVVRRWEGDPHAAR